MTDEATSQVADTVRADVWLWRARFFKTRTLAADFIEEGRIRLTRVGHTSRIDQPARNLKAGDSLIFALARQLSAVLSVALGERRGTATTARKLYPKLDAA